MTRFQFLMIRSMESGEALSEAMQETLDLGKAHPDWEMFERQSYADWVRGSDELDAEAPDTERVST